MGDKTGVPVSVHIMELCLGTKWTRNLRPSASDLQFALETLCYERASWRSWCGPRIPGDPAGRTPTLLIPADTSPPADVSFPWGCPDLVLLTAKLPPPNCPSCESAQRARFALFWFLSHRCMFVCTGGRLEMRASFPIGADGNGQVSAGRDRSGMLFLIGVS